MVKIIKRSGLLIPKDRFEYISIKESLERTTRTYDKSAFILNKFYDESEKFLLIPRYFPLDNYMVNYEIEDHSHEGQPIQIQHFIEPRSETQRKAMKYLRTNQNGILQLMPGVGKTVISIYIIAERKKKSFVLVHRDSLAEQWKNRFLEHTNLKEEQIARLKSSSFEDDLKKPIIISTVQTFLSLLNRQRKEFLLSLNDANVGVFIGDEVHTSVGAPTFSQCSIHIPAKYTYGLSATPYRYDGNGDIIEYHLGPIFEDDDIEGTMTPRVTVLLLDYEIDTPRRYTYIHWGGSFQRSRYLNMMYKSKPFMLALRSILSRLKDERDLICMIERIKLIDQIYDWLKHDSKAKFCGSEGLDTLNSKVTFATPGKCRDGIDAPHKDCVIMTSPISNIHQLVGRVTRGKEGKQTPIVVDMVDYGSKDISNTFSSRLAYYKKKEWEIQFVLFVNGNVRQIDENMAHEIIRGT